VVFSIYQNLCYTAEDWSTMQTAHQMASAVLQRDPTTHEHAERLARIVMKLFDQGIRDAKTLATQATDEETSISIMEGTPTDALPHNLIRFRN
jgi:hypothetical protein